MIITNFKSDKKIKAVITGIIDTGHHDKGTHTFYIEYSEINRDDYISEYRRYQSLYISNREESEFFRTMKALRLDMSGNDLDLSTLIGTKVEFEIDYQPQKFPIFKDIEFIEMLALTDEEMDNTIVLSIDDPETCIKDYEKLPRYIKKRIMASEEFKQGKLH